MPPQVYVPPPRSPEAPAALEALSRVPGPSPWYLERRGTEIHTVTVTIPDAFREAGELLVVAPSTAGGRRESGYETHLRLWILDLARGHLQIIPQDWFNNGAYDYGYQWVARFARLRLAGDIVGEAIRLGVFRLDQSHRQIAACVTEDLFFQPDPATAYD